MGFSFFLISELSPKFQKILSYWVPNAVNLMPGTQLSDIKVTFGKGVSITSIVWLNVAFWLQLLVSIMLKVTLYFPILLYKWVVIFLLDVSPSPNCHKYLALYKFTGVKVFVLPKQITIGFTLNVASTE